MVNDVPAVRAEIVKPPTKVASVELQVTPSFVPNVSSVVRRIWLFAVTAVVLTTMELEIALVGSATLPAGAEPHTAGDAEDEQLLAVPIDARARAFEICASKFVPSVVMLAEPPT
jgi:hypothetical protein